MIKDILVHIPTERPEQPVVDASVSLAATFAAHLDAIALGYIATSAAFVADGGDAAAVATLFEAEQRRAAGRTAADLAIFEREKILRGASLLADAVRVTLGPKSKSVLIQKSWGAWFRGRFWR